MKLIRKPALKYGANALAFSLAAATLLACGEKTAPTAESGAPQAVSAPVESDFIATLELSNPSDFPRLDEAVYLSYYELGLERNFSVPIAIWNQAQQIPVQAIDKDADGSNDGILFTVDVGVDETLNLRLVETDLATEVDKRTQAEISHKVGGQWVERKYEGGSFQNVKKLEVPAEHTDHSFFIRYEGPGIESDLVAYRVYLDWRNGFDIFGKRTQAPVLQGVGQDGFDSYHEMSDWGMDILKVGSALGVGGYGFWDGEQVVRVSDVQNWSVQVANNGGLYSSFVLDYQGWQPTADKQTDLRAVLSMHAGSRLVEVNAKTSTELENLVAGIVDHPGTELIVGDMDITGHAWTYIGTYGAQSLEGSNLGMGVLVKRKAIDEVTSDEHNQVLVLKPADSEIQYYFVAAWEKEVESRHGPITSKGQFESYLQREAEKLTMPLRQRLTTAVSEAATQQPLTADAALGWSKRLADSELERKTLDYAFGGYDHIRKRPSYFEYTTGMVMQAYDELNQVAPDTRYVQAVEQVMGSFVNDDGSINGYVQEKYNIDSVRAGTMLLRLYERGHGERYKKAVDTLREQLVHHPRTSEGAFWHKKRYPYQVWLDGVYMGIPFLAHYEQLMHESPDVEEVLAEFKLVHKRLKNPDTGLYYHAWDEKREQVWADGESGLSGYHWARGMGWLAMALVDVLDFIPEENVQEREYLLNMIAELAPVIEQHQDPETGTWWQIIDRPGERANYRESTASAMFAYFYAKALNQGYLPKDKYLDTAKKAYQGLLDEFVQVHADGTISITDMCQVAGLGYGRDGSYEYYMSEPIYDDDPKGTAPFITAGVEMYKLLKTKS
ncbi:Rhamnogalacturonyl hydrolase YesR [Microbulbifer donghaiensis]|uniref:Rhamnogalacturonyl hydrolase YesR n=1 Tax=Microbulbifer donghaiensis TaxID=494016 RepID=A0A1M5DZ12_9GAMM|nr:glycoside hydrolase family 88 protein [Microbulbifer donghaiensis]SHF72052.1 Rhamnogalacturonyl hydrolase YesR [Microbulbifer donghaiensis]